MSEQPLTPRSRTPMLIGVAAVTILIVVLGIWRAWPFFNRAVDGGGQQSVTDDQTSVPQLVRPATPDQSYVGSKVCATCHAEISRTYQRHPMSHSLAAVKDASPAEDYTEHPSFKAGPCEYRIERKSDGQVVHHEILPDTNGDVLYDQAVDIQYALGSGIRGRSYLIDREGVFFQSPIGWYSGKSWDLSPGYTPGRHQGFKRRITDGCLQCHAGRVNSTPERSDYFPEPAFHEASISCERCHGPGQKHVEFHEQLVEGKGRQAAGSDPIVNPEKLPSVEREAVCYQCHLQATERILRYGRSHHDFRPGQKLNEIWTVFLNGTGIETAGSTEVVTQVEQMHSSACFQRSEGRMGCTSCHDPHDSPDRDIRPKFYSAKCATCHSDQGCSVPVVEREKLPANGSCVHCHMPKLRAEIVPHTTQTDHRILRRPREKTTSKNPPLAHFQEAGFELSDVELARARGLMLIRLVEGSGRRELVAECETLLRRGLAAAPDDPEILEALGAACLVQGRAQDAEKYWREILQRWPKHERALLRLATLAHDAGRMREAKDWLAQFLEVNPWIVEAKGRNAHVLGQLGDLDHAIPMAVRALEIDPRLLPLYGWLSEAHAVLGNMAESERFARLGERIQKRLTE